MGGVRNISRHLPGKKAGSSVRAARISKENAADKPKGHRARPQTAKLVAVLDENLNVIEEFDSVWESLGFSPEESVSLEMRSDVMLQIEQFLRSRRWTQKVAAQRCGVAQPRISDLLRGRIDKFSLDALVNMASKLGIKMRITTKAA